MFTITWKKKKKKTKRKIKHHSSNHNLLYPLYGLGCLGVFILGLCGYIYFDHMTVEVQKWSISQTQKLGFSLKDLVVVGRSRVSEEEILAAVNLEQSDPLYTFEPQTTKDKLESYPWVESAFVQLRPPHTIFIQLEECIPVALWQYKGKHQLIDSKGHVIEGQNPQAFRDMIKVIGKDAAAHAPQVIKALEAFPQLRDQITALTHQHGHRWDLRLEGKIDVKLPEDNLEVALHKLQELKDEHNFSQGEIMTIDMRFPDKLILRLTPEATKRNQTLGRNA